MIVIDGYPTMVILFSLPVYRTGITRSHRNPILPLPEIGWNPKRSHAVNYHAQIVLPWHILFYHTTMCTTLTRCVLLYRAVYCHTTLCTIVSHSVLLQHKVYYYNMLCAIVPRCVILYYAMYYRTKSCTNRIQLCVGILPYYVVYYRTAPCTTVP